MARKKSKPTRKSRTAYLTGEDVFPTPETSRVLPRCDKSPAISVGEQRSVSEDRSRDSTGNGGGKSNSWTLPVITSNTAFGKTEDRPVDNTSRGNIRSTKPLEQLSQPLKEKQPSAELPLSEVTEERHVEGSKPTEQRVPVVGRSNANSGTKKAAKKTPRRRRCICMPTRKPQSRRVLKGEYEDSYSEATQKRKQQSIRVQSKILPQENRGTWHKDSLKEYDVEGSKPAEQRVPVVEQSNVNPGKKKAARKTPRKRRRICMPTGKSQSRRVLNGEHEDSYSQATQKRKWPIGKQAKISPEENEGRGHEDSLEECNVEGSKPTKQGVLTIEHSNANSGKKKVEKKTPRRRRCICMPTGKARLRRVQHEDSYSQPNHKRKQPIGVQTKLLPKESQGQWHEDSLEEYVVEGSEPMEQKVLVVKQSNANSAKKEKKGAKKTPRKRRSVCMPTGKPRSRKVSKGEHEDSYSQATQKRKQAVGVQKEHRGHWHEEPPEEGSTDELSDTLLKGQHCNRRLGAMSKATSLVEDACGQSESPMKGKRLKTTSQDGPRSKMPKIASDPIDLLVLSPMEETTITRCEGRGPFPELAGVASKKKQGSKQAEAISQRKSDSGVSNVKPGSRPTMTSQKGMSNAKQPDTSEQTRISSTGNQSSGKRAEPLSRELTRELEGRERHSMRKRKADLDENSCSQHPRGESERNTSRRQPNPAKKARVQRAKINITADQGKAAVKIRVTEWQLTQRSTSQWKPVSSQADRLILDVMQSSTG